MGLASEVPTCTVGLQMGFGNPIQAFAVFSWNVLSWTCSSPHIFFRCGCSLIHAGIRSGCCQHPEARVTSILLSQLRAARPALQGAQGEKWQILPLGGKVQLPQRAGGFLQKAVRGFKEASLIMKHMIIENVQTDLSLLEHRPAH